jgi:predicted Zn-dependent peptidase
MTTAATAARAETPPAPGPAVPFKLPPRHDLALDNGGKVTLLPFGAVPKACVTWVVRAGNVHESAQQTWLADTTGELLREGTRTQTAAQLADAAADLGGDLSIDVRPDETLVTLEVLAEMAPRAVALVGDVVRNPLLPAERLPNVIGTLVRELTIDRTQPGILAREQLQDVLYAGQAYGRTLPTEAMLRGYTIDDVRKFYAANYGAARSHLYVIGRFDAAAVERAARQTLGGWTRGPDPSPPPPPPANVTPQLRVVDRPGAVQSTLAIGAPVPATQSADFMPLVVTDILLGGGGIYSGRIASNLREDKGYSYSPSSSLEARDHAATWRDQADVPTAVTGASLTEIFKELARLAAQPPTALELHAVQQFIAGAFVIGGSSRAGLLQLLRFVDEQQLGDDWLRDYVARVMAVTPADVQRVAQQYLDDKKMTIVVVGDKKLVDKQLTPWRKALTPRRKR